MTNTATTDMPKPMPLLCRLGFHRWTCWGAKFMVPGTSYALEYQQRTCLGCGHVDERRI